MSARWHQHAPGLGRAGEGELAHLGIGAELRPIALESPVMTLSTPNTGVPRLGHGERRVGRLARGLDPTEHRRRAPAPRVIIAFGKFHGVMSAHTPIGCLITRTRWPGAAG